MTQTTTTQPLLAATVTANPFARIVGKDEPAWTVAAAAQVSFPGEIVRFEPPPAISDAPSGATGDYAQIDATLALASEAPTSVPAPGVGYSGLSAAQRFAFLHWLRTPTAAAPRAFQWLYLANLEVRLLQSQPWLLAARDELLRLAATATWDVHLVAPRLLLAFWLAQDGAGLRRWLTSAPPVDAELMDIALGMQARLAAPLTAAELPAILGTWRMPTPRIAPAVLELRLNTLTATLGTDPLAHAAGAASPAPDFAAWRCLHRDLRLALPQPRVRGSIEPMLADMLAQSAPAEVAPMNDEAETATALAAHDDLAKAHLIIEFRQSRSEYFAWALRQAQKQAGFQQLMDEDRHIVYRAPFRRSEQRRFWNLWDCVQSWSSTRLYCQGRELEKWQVYPGSPHLR